MKTFTRRNSGKGRPSTPTGVAPHSTYYDSSIDQEELLVESPASQVKIARRSTPSTGSPAAPQLSAEPKSATSSGTKRAGSQKEEPVGALKKPRSSSILCQLNLASTQPSSPDAAPLEAHGATKDPFAFPPSSPDSSPVKARPATGKQVLLPTTKPSQPKAETLNVAQTPTSCKSAASAGPADTADAANTQPNSKEIVLPRAQVLLPAASAAAIGGRQSPRRTARVDSASKGTAATPTVTRSSSCPPQVAPSTATEVGRQKKQTPQQLPQQQVERQQRDLQQQQANAADARKGSPSVSSQVIAPQSAKDTSPQEPIAEPSSQLSDASPALNDRPSRLRQGSNTSAKAAPARHPAEVLQVSQAQAGQVSASTGVSRNPSQHLSSAPNTASRKVTPFGASSQQAPLARSSLLMLLPDRKGSATRPAAAGKPLPAAARQGSQTGSQGDRGRVRFVEEAPKQSGSQQQQAVTGASALTEQAAAVAILPEQDAPMPSTRPGGTTGLVWPAAGRNAVPVGRQAVLPHMMSRGGVGRLGWAGGASIWGAQGAEATRALTPSQQSVAEAQEAGEDVALQDEASYALDGLRPTATVATQRESLACLVELMATRRGRAALRAEGLAQQVLNSTSKLPLISSDPVLSLAGAVLLACMSTPDAHAGYLTTPAAMRLASQLLSTQHSINTVNQAQDHAVSTAAACPVAHDSGSLGSTVDLDTAGAACSKRVLKLIREGPLARHLQGLLGHTGAHLGCTQLVCVALATATAADPSRIQCMEAAKANMCKEGLLQLLAQHVVQNCQAVWTVLTSNAQAPQQQQADTSADALGADGKFQHSDALQQLHELLLSLRLMLQVLENATFTCPENEVHLLACTVQLHGVDLHAQAALQGQQSGADQPVSISVVEAVMYGMGLLSQLFMCYTPLPLPAAPQQPSRQQQREEKPASESQHTKRQRREQKQVQQSNSPAAAGTSASPTGGASTALSGKPCWASVDSLAGQLWGMQGESAAQLSSACSQALQAGLGLLVNLTHNHEAARQQMAAAGGLQHILHLVSWCAAARAAPPPVDTLSKSPPSSQNPAPSTHPASLSPAETARPAGQSHPSQDSGSTAAADQNVPTYDGSCGPALRAHKGHVLTHSELLNVCLGLLINCSARCPSMRQQLRLAQASCACAPTDDMQPAATVCQQDAATAAAHQVRSESVLMCHAVPLLCALLHAVMDEDQDKVQGQTSGRAAAVSGSRRDSLHRASAPAAGQDQIGNDKSVGQAHRQGSVTKTFVRASRAGSRTPKAQHGGNGAATGSAGDMGSQGSPEGGLEGVVGNCSNNENVLQSSTPMEVDAPTDAKAVDEPKAIPVAADLGEDVGLAGDQHGSSDRGGSGGGALVGEEVTEDEVRGQQEDAQASIVQAYASLLLGILFQDCEASRRAAQALLPGHSLALVVGCIVKTHAFYERTGAITDSSRQVMVQLLQVLVPLVMPDTAGTAVPAVQQLQISAPEKV